MCVFFFFFNDTATTEIYTLSLHDALPISDRGLMPGALGVDRAGADACVAALRPHQRAQPEARAAADDGGVQRSEEHTFELQSRQYLVCRLLLEKKKKKCSNNLHNHVDVIR